jgi:hypothetical protein
LLIFTFQITFTLLRVLAKGITRDGGVKSAHVIIELLHASQASHALLMPQQKKLDAENALLAQKTKKQRWKIRAKCALVRMVTSLPD